jgi:hypothetical protein
VGAAVGGFNEAGGGADIGETECGGREGCKSLSGGGFLVRCGLVVGAAAGVLAEGFIGLETGLSACGPFSSSGLMSASKAVEWIGFFLGQSNTAYSRTSGAASMREIIWLAAQSSAIAMRPSCPEVDAFFMF